MLEEKYARVEVIDAASRSHQGVVVKRTETEIHLVENPLMPHCEPKVIALSDDMEIFPSKVSPMPEGLLSRLEKEQIWDLVAFVVAGGDPQHAAFQTK